MMPMGTLHWAIFFAGCVVASTAAYFLGRTDAQRRLARMRDVWVVVNPRGAFGLEIFEESRLRTHAEQLARKHRPKYPEIVVMTKTAWREHMTRQWLSDDYWNAVDHVEALVRSVNTQNTQPHPDVVETTVLPVIAEVEEKPLLRVAGDGKIQQVVHAQLSQADIDRLEEIRLGIHVVQGRTHHVDEVLRTLQESLDEFRMHIRATRRMVERIDRETRDTHSVTEELKAILDEGAANADVPQHSGQSGRPAGGSAHPDEAA